MFLDVTTDAPGFVPGGVLAASVSVDGGAPAPAMGQLVAASYFSHAKTPTLSDLVGAAKAPARLVR